MNLRLFLLQHLQVLDGHGLLVEHAAVYRERLLVERSLGTLLGPEERTLRNDRHEVLLVFGLVLSFLETRAFLEVVVLSGRTSNLVDDGDVVVLDVDLRRLLLSAEHVLDVAVLKMLSVLWFGWRSKGLRELLLRHELARKVALLLV